MPRSVIFYRNSALGRMSPLVAAAKIGNVQEVQRLVRSKRMQEFFFCVLSGVKRTLENRKNSWKIFHLRPMYPFIPVPNCRENSLFIFFFLTYPYDI